MTTQNEKTEKEISESLLVRMEKENIIRVLQWKNATQDIQLTRENARQQGRKEGIEEATNKIDEVLMKGGTIDEIFTSLYETINNLRKKKGD